MRKASTVERAADRWLKGTTRWAKERALQGQLVESLPLAVWAFDLGLRKVSRRSGNTATFTLNRLHLRHLGVEIGDMVRLTMSKDGTLTIRKATEREIDQVKTRAKLTILLGRKTKKAAS